MLERVEFAWFANDYLLVIVSRTPAQPGSQLLAETEIFFYESIPLYTPPHRAPAVTVRIRDVALCIFCKAAPKGECKCLRESDALMFPVSPPASLSTAAQSFSLAPATHNITWAKFLTALTRCRQNGFLTSFIGTSDAKGELVDQVRVMYSYNLTFGTQAAISEGINLRLKQLLLARSLITHQQRRPEHVSSVDIAQKFGVIDTPSIAVNNGDDVNTGNSQQMPMSRSWTPGSAIPLSDCTERRGSRMRNGGERHSSGGATRSEESIPSLPIATELSRKRRLEAGSCSTEKNTKSHDSTGETTPNPFLSTILNSKKEKSSTPTTLANFAEMSALMPPVPIQQPPKSANPLFSGVQATLGEAFGFELQGAPPKRSATAQNCILPSPISMIMDFNAESAKKKVRLEGSKDDGVLGLSFDTAATGWDGSLGENERQRRQREFSWAPATERAMSGLCRAFGMDRSLLGTPSSPGSLLKEGNAQTPGSRIEAQKIYVPREDVNESRTGIQCEVCGATFSKRANLVRHTKTVHNNVKPFICETCGSKFGLKADLQRHMRNIHEKRAFCCRTCGKSFAEQEDLDFHTRVAHEKDLRPFKCGQCEIKFGRRSSRRRHEQTVHTDKRFHCDLCDKSYSQRFDMIKHRRKAHGKK